MHYLELLAPARTADIGIAAVDCGADAVYIGGPGYGARKDAGNSISDIHALCTYAHKFGSRVFMTVNTLIYPSEVDEVHDMMLEAQDAGVDAFIIQDLRITNWGDIRVPLHASTQCAVRSVEKARYLESLGCSRIVLERELSLKEIKEIASSVNCEVECFVHGALCVCYSGECYLSEWLDGRSANRGECIQACRSRYDLHDGDGKVLIKDKSLLSLKDLDLSQRLEDLSGAGVCSFKIEGRLKNISYVRNTVRRYSELLDRLVSANPSKYRRSSYGKVSSNFSPDLSKTFNRGFTQLYFDGVRSKSWSSMEMPKSMGEYIGKILDVTYAPDSRTMELTISRRKGVSPISNGDGLSFLSGSEIIGFRADVCRADKIVCKRVTGAKKGTDLFRNLDIAFEKNLDAGCSRHLEVQADIFVDTDGTVTVEAVSEDGRKVTTRMSDKKDIAKNHERMLSMIRTQLSKNEGHYHLSVNKISQSGSPMPLMSSADLNALRRKVAADMDRFPFHILPMKTGNKTSCNISGKEEAEQIGHHTGCLMRTKYCIRYELGLCPVHQGAKDKGPLYIVNNGKRLSLSFDCRNCEMTVNTVK